MNERTERLGNVFREAMTNTEGDSMHKVDVGFKALQMEILKDLPIGLRVNYLLNILSKYDVDRCEINWGKVNDLLRENRDPYGFNNFGDVGSIKELYGVSVDILVAGEGLGAWYRGVCADCGKVFYMNKGEVDFYISRNYPLPKRCPECRKLRKDRGNK